MNSKQINCQRNVIFSLTLDLVSLETSRRFDLSSRSLGHVMFSFPGTAQEAGAGGRSGAAGIPVHGSLMGRFSLYIWLLSLFFWSIVALWLALWCCQMKTECPVASVSSHERKHHVTKASR